ncbi:MAG: lipoprotein-releasing ABC transporter ATP-binding protein LolD [Gammaproteobacteria bacterium]
MSDQTVLSAKQLTKTYHEGKLSVSVLCGIDLNIAKGEQVAILGASGAGKSTLLHLLGGLDKPTSGEVMVKGQNIHHLSEKARCKLRNHTLGFVYQFHHLLPEFNVLENVCMPLLIRNMKPKMAEKQASEILNNVGLSQRLNHKLSELSGGERQRTAIARALVTHPQCVMADEPTGNLDDRTSDKVYATMLELNRALQTSFIIVTHDLRLTKHMDRTLVLENGILREHDA